MSSMVRFLVMVACACAASFPAFAHHVGKIEPARLYALPTDPQVAVTGVVSEIAVVDAARGIRHRLLAVTDESGKRYLVAGATQPVLRAARALRDLGPQRRPHALRRKRDTRRERPVDGGSQARRRHDRGHAAPGPCRQFRRQSERVLLRDRRRGHAAIPDRPRRADRRTRERDARRRDGPDRRQRRALRRRDRHPRSRCVARPRGKAARHDELHRAAGQVPHQRQRTVHLQRGSVHRRLAGLVRVRGRAGQERRGVLQGDLVRPATALRPRGGQRQRRLAARGNGHARVVQHQRDRHRSGERGRRARLQPQCLHRPRLRVHQQRAGLRLVRPGLRRTGNARGSSRRRACS